MTAPEFLARLREAAGPWVDEWGESIYPTEREIPALFAMRRVRGRSALLVRIAEASEALSIGHVLKRFYRELRNSLFPVSPPLLACIKASPNNKSVKYGGTGMYWDVKVTA